MKDCGRLISLCLKRRRILKKDLGEFIGVMPQNVNKILSRSSMDADVLEKCCKFLNLDPAEFFDFRPSYDGSGDAESVSSLSDQRDDYSRAEMQLMELLLTEKDKRIANLEMTVAALQELVRRGGNLASDGGQIADNVK